MHFEEIATRGAGPKVLKMDSEGGCARTLTISGSRLNKLLPT